LITAARVEIGVVDLFVVSQRGRGWRVLTLQRAQTTRCPGAWETVHGRIERGETPQAAAVRELREETGLAPVRLYNVTAHAFYLHRQATVEIAVTFCAFVDGEPHITLGEEHARAEWLSRAGAAKRFVWPSERENLARAWALLKRGDAGPLEDVLRVT
jgi:8-oxo-dGTP pyrophosphatase MutT (NUDIX family)